MACMDHTNRPAPAVELACSLPTRQASQQLGEWSVLQGKAVAVTAVTDGVRMTFPADIADEVEDLARREEACCSFLSIAVHRGTGTVVLEVTSPVPEALPLISMLAGFPGP